MQERNDLGKFFNPFPADVKKALERFASKCEFDPYTGCVEFNGAKSLSQGGSGVYGAFWFNGKMHYAHRWAAEYIHGLKVDVSVEVHHKCRNTVCVQHLESLTPEAHREQTWLFRQRQICGQEHWEPLKPDPIASDELPFHDLPDWLAPFKEIKYDNPPF